MTEGRADGDASGWAGSCAGLEGANCDRRDARCLPLGHLQALHAFAAGLTRRAWK